MGAGDSKLASRKNKRYVKTHETVAGDHLCGRDPDCAHAAGATRATTPPPAAAAQPSAVFKPEEIEALVAQIALYPDSIVTQVLMASTYPVEIVQADRWATENKNLKGDALTAALEKNNWDPSVKSLVNFPQGPDDDE